MKIEPLYTADYPTEVARNSECRRGPHIRSKSHSEAVNTALLCGEPRQLKFRACGCETERTKKQSRKIGQFRREGPRKQCPTERRTRRRAIRGPSAYLTRMKSEGVREATFHRLSVTETGKNMEMIGENIHAFAVRRRGKERTGKEPKMSGIH